MSFHHLISGECGTNNSLVQLSNLLSRENPVHRTQSHPAANYVNEFLTQNPHAPPIQTFQMNDILHSLNEVQNETNFKTTGHNWSEEYQGTSGVTNRIQMPFINSTHFAMKPALSVMPTTNLPFNSCYYEKPYIPIQYLEESCNDTSIVIDTDQNELKKKAKEFVECVAGQSVANSEFASFIEKISENPQTVSGEKLLESAQANDTIVDEDLEKIDTTEQDEWLKLKENLKHPWMLSVDLNIDPYPTYNFAQENNMLENMNALEIGKQKLKAGDIPGAVICFEAAVKQNPSLVEGWLLLGTSQAENEQDPQAIAALNKCVKLDPTCLQAYMALGSSYTNENYPHFAYKAFNDWLKANKKYSDLVPLDIDIAKMSNFQLQDHIQSLFLRAAQINPSEIDPDIQCALGVLFNISQDYSKAVDCFKSALMVQMNDSKLWNKLGATLANGERSEEAVDAYYQALSLEPGFIRARYNIGITCMNLGAYKEAAEHFLTALNQQNQAQKEIMNVSHENMSSAIWSTFRMVCAFMGRHDITPLINNRDLSELNKLFEMK